MATESKKKTTKKVSDDTKRSIKKMEAERREKAMKHVEKKDDRVSFSEWWVKRSSNIPKAHMKEIVLADFKGRGLSDKEKMADYDRALKAYGV